MGTVDFMAPEQGIDSRRVDHRADIYSLGCTLCYLLTGRAPFDGGNVLARLMAHQDRPPCRCVVARPDIPEAIDTVYQKMMAKNPADRPASMTDVVKLMDACRSTCGSVEQARSGLNVFAATVTVDRDSPRLTVRELVMGRDEPTNVQLGPGPVLVDRDQRGPAKPVGRRAMAIPRSLSFALAGLGVAAMVGLGCTLYFALDRPGRSGSASRGPSCAGPIVALPARVQSLWALPSRRRRLGRGRPRTLTWRRSFPSTRPTISRGASKRWPSPTTASAADRELVRVCAHGRRRRRHKRSPNTRLARRLAVHRPTVAMTPDGRLALIGTGTVRNDNFERAKVNESDGILWFWDLATGEQRFPKQQPYHGSVASVAISADGLRGLSASHDGELTLWNLKSGKRRSLGKQRGDAPEYELDFFPMVFFADGRHAATAVRDKLVRIWDLDTGREQAPWSGTATQFRACRSRPTAAASSRAAMTGPSSSGTSPAGQSSTAS